MRRASERWCWSPSLGPRIAPSESRGVGVAALGSMAERGALGAAKVLSSGRCLTSGPARRAGTSRIPPERWFLKHNAWLSVELTAPQGGRDRPDPGIGPDWGEPVIALPQP